MEKLVPGVQAEVNEVDGETISLIMDVDASKFIEAGLYDEENRPDTKQRFYSVEELLDEMSNKDIIKSALQYLVWRYERNKKLKCRYDSLMSQAKKRIFDIESGKFKDLFPMEAKREVARYWVLIGRLQKRKFQQLNS
jgi:hypothetical protein